MSADHQPAFASNRDWSQHAGEPTLCGYTARQVLELEAALRFYADPASYENTTPRTVRAVITDQGQRAREALRV